jgi:hypothetical protein
VIKVAFLEEVITNQCYEFTANQIEELIEVVRMLDILGTELRWKEYGLLVE